MSDQGDLFSKDRNLSAGEAARDEGLRQVSISNSHWMDEAIKTLPKMRIVKDYATGEEMRKFLLGEGIDSPKTHKAWGALVNAAARRGIIRDTGRYAKMEDERSHARRTPLWQFVTR